MNSTNLLMTKNSIAALFILLLITTQGCAVKFGHDFDPQGFHDWVERGETTAKQVRDRLGAPTSQGMIMEGDGTTLKRYIYYYGKGTMSNMKDAKFKMLEVRFDESNLVHSFNWSAAKK